MSPSGRRCRSASGAGTGRPDRGVAAYGLGHRAGIRPMRWMLVTGGTGGYRGVTGDAPLGPGSLVLVRPGEPHWYGPSPGAVWDEAYCAVTGPAFDLAARRGALGARPRR
ncbi:MAG: AraC family ligand binding domain-containing protein [Tetrasphaera sp.]|nr:AraC family ligand binding domain-containing protein [Tetrasphaera sp.]